MANKRTAELNTMAVSVALTEGLLVVDTTGLQAADAEQQKIVIPTLLSNFAVSGQDFVINELELTKVNTTNNLTDEVMLINDANEVRVRSIETLLAGTQAVKSAFSFITDPNTESYINTGETQQVINQQNAGKLISLQTQIDEVETVGATGTINAAATPQAIPTALTVFDFGVLFQSNNTNIFELNDLSNEIDYNVDGVYDNNVYLEITNSANQDRTATFTLRNKATLDVIVEANVFVPANGAWSGTWVDRYEISDSPIVAEIVMIASDSGLEIQTAQASITSIASQIQLDLYAKKAENETITGSWTFDTTQTFNTGLDVGYINESGGNLGIGTTTPGEKLEVIGNMSVSGDISTISSFIGTYDGQGYARIFSTSLGGGIESNDSDGNSYFRLRGYESTAGGFIKNKIKIGSDAIPNEGLDIDGRLALSNQSEPSTPTGGGVLFTQLGSLKYKGSSGTVTTIAPA